MDVAHAILLYGKIDFSRLTADYLSAKFEVFYVYHKMSEQKMDILNI